MPMRMVDRAFRLFREDQVACVRTALHDAFAADKDRRGPKPVVLQNAELVGVEVPGGRKGSIPVPSIVLEFDLPARVCKLRTNADKVCSKTRFAVRFGPEWYTFSEHWCVHVHMVQARLSASTT